MRTHLIATTALVALFAFGPAHAQGTGQTESTPATQPQTNAADQEQPEAAQQQTSPSGQASTSGAANAQGTDRVLVTVNGTDIRQSDVVNAIEGLPPQIQQMPPQMLLPAVVDQLLQRELILARGYSERLQRDPAVLAIVEPQTKMLEEQAVVNVWLERELNERVTDQQVQEALQQLQAANPDANTTLDQVRPQLESALRQQAVRDIAAELRQDAEITYYGPSGEPLPGDPAGAANGQGQTNATEPAPSGQSGAETSDESDTPSGQSN